MKRSRRSIYALILAAAICFSPAGPSIFVPVANAQNSSRPAQAVGQQVITPTVSTALTVPSSAQWAMITVRSNGVHISFDGTAATTSDHYFPANTVFPALNGNLLLQGMRFIDSSDGASTVYVTYFQAR